MPSDAHAHPYDLIRLDPDAEKERLSLGVVCCASAWNEAEFLFQEALARESAAAGGPRLILSFGAHPQLAALDAEAARKSLALLERLASEKRIGAAGEIGFDYFDAAYRSSADLQEELFRVQLDAASAFGLPCVLHLRRAAHKAFEYAKKLAALPAVVFHSYSGTAGEAASLLRRGVNAFFSFGTPVCLNHKRAMEACVSIPPERLLIETDAPYQSLRGKERSSWADLLTVAGTVASLRAAAGTSCAKTEEVIEITEENFRRAYGPF